MDSSKVMASISPANLDLPRQSSIHSLTLSELQTDPSKNFGSMNMDELLKNIYPDSETFSVAGESGACGNGVGLTSQGSFSLPKCVGNKTVDEVWKEIVSGSGDNREPEMTLEDFFTKAGAVKEEDVRLSTVAPVPGYAVDSIINAPQFQASGLDMQSATSAPGGFGIDLVGFRNGIVAAGAPAAGGGTARGKRRAVEEPSVDRATQQKQRICD